MTKELRRLSVLVLLMFLSLFVALSWIQVVEAESLAQNSHNKRTLLDSFEVQRGSILVEGQQIASSVPSDDMYSYQRVYTDPGLWAGITGYYNPVLGVATGIEQAMNADLSGTGAAQFFAEIERIISGQPPRGSHVVLSLNTAGQRAAAEALQGLQGAVVAMEPKTGRILVMASSPAYDTNALAVHDADAVEATYDQLVEDDTDPLFNRAIGGDLNPPGSTFKVVVVAAALSTGQWTMSSTLPNPASYTLPGTTTPVHNAWGGACGSGPTVTIADALRLSCNIPMAELAVELGDEVIRDTAQKFGFNQSFDLPLEATASTYPESLSDDETGLSGFGQGDGLRATPLQMAMVAAGVANDGTVMMPRLVDSVLGDDLSVQKETQSQALGQAITPEIADALTEVLVAGVQDGAAQGARIDGVDVAGKTGTAENGDTRPYTLWFTGFAPADDPEIAVAVVVEDGGGMDQSGSGDGIASPIAKKVIEAVLGR